MSTACVNISSLVKIADRETFDTVLKVAIQPLVQVGSLCDSSLRKREKRRSMH